MRVVICGGGVIGACTAYFLSRRGIDVIVVERSEVPGARLVRRHSSGCAGAAKFCASCDPARRDRRRLGLPPHDRL